MNKRLIYLLIASLVPLCCTGQSYKFSFETGIGFYKMNALRTMQKRMLFQYNSLPVRAIDQFPGYLTQSLALVSLLDSKSHFGINATHFTTGGRNSVRDYSGEYRLDMLVNAIQLGIELDHCFSLSDRFDFIMKLRGGKVYSNLKVTESLNIYNVVNDDNSDKYKQSNFFFEPKIGFSYHITKILSTDIGLGYDRCFLNEDNNLIDWTGLRTHIGVSLSI